MRHINNINIGHPCGDKSGSPFRGRCVTVSQRRPCNPDEYTFDRSDLYGDLYSWRGDEHPSLFAVDLKGLCLGLETGETAIEVHQRVASLFKGHSSESNQHAAVMKIVFHIRGELLTSSAHPGSM